MLIASCLQKKPSKRPTASMLMQHPFFLKHASVILRSAERSHAKTTPKSDRTPVPPCVADKNIMNLLSADDDENDNATPQSKPCGERVQNTQKSQSALSRLTEHRISQAGSRPTTPSYSSYDYMAEEDFEEDTIINSIRFQHLETILEKIDERYQQYAELRRRNKERKQQTSRSERLNEASCRSMMSASNKTFFKSINDPLTPIPNISSYIGRKKWQYFASQLHLSLDTVTDNAVRVINPKFFAKT